MTTSPRSDHDTPMSAPPPRPATDRPESAPSDPPYNDRLYRLLPVVYRQHDVELTEPLRALLSVISEQVDLLEADIAQRYEDWFIETCQDWVVPYIGDLIGYRPVHEAGEPGDVDAPGGRQRNRILIPRREVANTLRYRRRKGTLALLELLARDVAGWSAHAVEFGASRSQTPSVSDPRPDRGRAVDLRDGDALDALGSAFDRLSHLVDLRRPGSYRTPGRQGTAGVGLFIARLKTHPVTGSVAYCVEDVGSHCFTFSPLANDLPLFNGPETHIGPAEGDGPLRLPIPIRRRAFAERVEGDPERQQASGRYYGEGKSLAIWVTGWEKTAERRLVPRESVIPADLREWQYRPRRGQVAVDPELGRIAFAPDNVPEEVTVSYRYGFSADLGGGEYQRTLAPVSTGAAVYRVSARGGEAHGSIRDALQLWKDRRPTVAVIEIVDSQVYDEERIHIELGADQSLEVRAVDGARPVVRLLDWTAGRADALTVLGRGPRSRLTLDGLLVMGRGLQLRGELAEIRIRHSTLVPGWALHHDCRPQRSHEPSLTLMNTDARVVVDRSILGAIHNHQDERRREPNTIVLSDSILDGMDREGQALAAPGSRLAHATLTIRSSTVFGKILAHAIELGENSIFDGVVRVARRQHGCLRFCFVPPGSRTPPRYECQPDAATRGFRGEARARVESDVVPVFNSTRYGTADYGQLGDACPDEIRRGADDESEMGVFHHLYAPQRDANLRTRLDEYLPAGVDVDLIHIT